MLTSGCVVNTSSSGAKRLPELLRFGAHTCESGRSHDRSKLVLHDFALSGRDTRSCYAHLTTTGWSLWLDDLIAPGNILLRVVELIEGSPEPLVETADLHSEIGGHVLEFGDHEVISIRKDASVEANVFFQPLFERERRHPYDEGEDCLLGITDEDHRGDA